MRGHCFISIMRAASSARDPEGMKITVRCAMLLRVIRRISCSKLLSHNGLERVLGSKLFVCISQSESDDECATRMGITSMYDPLKTAVDECSVNPVHLRGRSVSNGSGAVDGTSASSQHTAVDIFLPNKLAVPMGSAPAVLHSKKPDGHCSNALGRPLHGHIAASPRCWVEFAHPAFISGLE